MCTPFIHLVRSLVNLFLLGFFLLFFVILYTVLFARYDPVDDTWLELPPMKTSRALAGSVVFRDHIYVIG